MATLVNTGCKLTADWPAGSAEGSSFWIIGLLNVLLPMRNVFLTNLTPGYLLRLTPQGLFQTVKLQAYWKHLHAMADEQEPGSSLIVNELHPSDEYICLTQQLLRETFSCGK